MKEGFNPEGFVKEQVGNIRKKIGSNRALIAVSGGVDSTTSAVLTYHAIGGNLLCVILDDAFMREGEPEKVAELLSRPPLGLPMRILNVQERFLNAMKGLRDAEEKRKRFRETFYQVLGETAEKEGCKFLVQGTILADIVETKGGIKTQHNVLEQMGINTQENFGFQIVEPLASLYKEEVRMVARYLKVPPEISERQPFPGPGLSVRVVGEIKEDKLSSLKKATAIVEEKLAKHKPSQYFAAILDNAASLDPPNLTKIQQTVASFLNMPARQVTVKVFQDKATGIKQGKRFYGEILAIKAQKETKGAYQPPIESLTALQTKIVTENPTFSRILYAVQETAPKQPYVIVIRAIQTQNFLTAQVSNIPWQSLNEAAQEILKLCPNVSSVYYDITPKPPATIELE